MSAALLKVTMLTATLTIFPTPQRELSSKRLPGWERRWFASPFLPPSNIVSPRLPFYPCACAHIEVDCDNTRRQSRMFRELSRCIHPHEEIAPPDRKISASPQTVAACRSRRPRTRQDKTGC